MVAATHAAGLLFSFTTSGRSSRSSPTTRAPMEATRCSPQVVVTPTGWSQDGPEPAPLPCENGFHSFLQSLYGLAVQGLRSWQLRGMLYKNQLFQLRISCNNTYIYIIYIYIHVYIYNIHVCIYIYSVYVYVYSIYISSLYQVACRIIVASPTNFPHYLRSPY